jgi:hypothetical protein
MQIAIDARCLEKMNDDLEKQFVLAVLGQLVSRHPEVSFAIIGYSQYLVEYKNVQNTLVPEVRSYWALRSWYRRKLPALLKRLNVQQLLLLNGCPANTNIPQLVFVSSLASLQKVSGGQWKALAKRFVLKRLTKSDVIATFTEGQQVQLAAIKGLSAEKITSVGYTVPEAYKPITWKEREQFIDEQTGGREYFLVPQETLGSNLILLLKAFSLFKKRQQSSMQLIIAGNFSPTNYDPEKLDTYKYKADVVMLPNTSPAQMATLTACAYAVVMADEKKPAAFAAAAAIHCHVPVVGFEGNNALQQVTGEAALYAANTPESLAEKLKDVYKNENLRQQLVAQASLQASLLSENEKAEKLWNCLKMAAAQNQPTFTAQ